MSDEVDHATVLADQHLERSIRAARQPVPIGAPGDFWGRISIAEDDDGCWLWTGAVMGKTGYGSVQINRRARGVHRVMAEMALGRTLDRYELVCHRCDNRICCNPAHLFIGSYADNAQDMIRKGRGKGPLNDNARKTRCPKGHTYDAVGRRGDGSLFRICKRCSSSQKAASKRRLRELRMKNVGDDSLRLVAGWCAPCRDSRQMNSVFRNRKD